MRDIGKNIRDERLKKGWTQDQLAEKLYCTRQTVSNYEQGRSRPDIETVMRIAEVLEVDVGILLYARPSVRRRRRAVVILAAGLLLLAVLCVLYYFAYEEALRIRGTQYRILPYALLLLFGRPLLSFLGGWDAMQAVSLLADLRTPGGRTLLTGRILAAGIPACMVLLFQIPAVLQLAGLQLPGILASLGSVFYWTASSRWAWIVRLAFWSVAGAAFRFFMMPPLPYGEKGGSGEG